MPATLLRFLFALHNYALGCVVGLQPLQLKRKTLLI